MKKMIALVLAMVLLLCGCGKAPVETQPTTAAPTTAPTEATTEPTTEPTTAPTTEPAPVYTNPLNGEILEEPYDGRLFAVTISNIPDALPHVGVTEADIYMEMFVNGSIIRGLALYTDITGVETIGSVRSTRLMFNDIVTHYDALLAHAGGSSQVLTDARNRGLDNFNIDTWDRTSYSFRDETRKKLGWEHCLMGIGSGLVEHAAEKGMATTQDPEKSYNLTFAEDGTPAGGEAADEITVRITYHGTWKDTTMKYDPALGEYAYWQYGKLMADGVTGEPETFENVVIMFANISKEGIYHVADFVAGGEGYFACGGQLIPIKWGCDGEDQPFWFTTQDGEPLPFGVGSTYIAITTPDSPVTYSAAEPEVPETTETE